LKKGKKNLLMENEENVKERRKREIKKLPLSKKVILRPASTKVVTWNRTRCEGNCINCVGYITSN
jgi:hypothetical protein